MRSVVREGERVCTTKKPTDLAGAGAQSVCVCVCARVRGRTGECGE